MQVLTYFCVARDLLARNPHPHPLIYMRGVQHRTLGSIIDFIYHGEAEVLPLVFVSVLVFLFLWVFLFVSPFL